MIAASILGSKLAGEILTQFFEFKLKLCLFVLSSIGTELGILDPIAHKVDL